MSNWLFVLRWEEPKSEAWLAECLSGLNVGLVRNMNELSKATDMDFAVKARIDGETIVCDWYFPSRVNNKIISRLFTEAGKELKKKLECVVSWAEKP